MVVFESVQTPSWESKSCWKVLLSVDLHEKAIKFPIYILSVQQFFLYFIFFIWVLRSVNVISPNRSVGQKQEIPEENYLMTRKQNLSGLICVKNLVYKISKDSESKIYFIETERMQTLRKSSHYGVINITFWEKHKMHGSVRWKCIRKNVIYI